MSAREFDCVECGRHIVTIVLCLGVEHGLCVACLMHPGWFKIPEFRDALAPDHDGLDAVERLQSKEAR